MRAAERFRYLVLAAQREANRMLGRQLRGIGMTPSQAETLRVLCDCPPLTLTGLGERLVCETGRNPSRLVGRLVAMGLVKRRQRAADQREVELSVTREGERRGRLIREIEEALYDQFDALVADRDIGSTLVVLNRFVAHLPAGHAVALRGLAAEKCGLSLE